MYGLDKAKESIRKNNFSILVEGQMDLILSHQALWKNTIATSGTSLSDVTFSKENIISNLGLVRRISNNIVLAFDGDNAGLKATERAGKIALSLGMDVKVAKLPEGLDPADLISKKGEGEWKESIKNAKHIIEFLVDKILQNYSNDLRKIGREIKEKILPFINLISSVIEKEFFLKRISDISQIPVAALKDDLQKISEEGKFEKMEAGGIEEANKELRKKDYILKRLLGIIFWQNSKKEKVFEVDGVLKELVDILNLSKEEIHEAYKDSIEDLIFEAEVFYEEGADLNKDVLELLNNLKEEQLKEELMLKMRELHVAEENKDKAKSEQILKECQVINNKIQGFKNSRIK